jgi:MFS family permease
MRDKDPMERHTPRAPLAQLLLRVFLPFACGYFLSYLFRSINAVAAPHIVRSVDLEAGSLGLMTSAYFLAFAAFQLPLGILLDRYGPRRVEAGLLCVAALGAAVFAAADGVPGLLAGRALIGLGVSACLMGAFKAMVTWFPSQRLPLLNGGILACGGLGALTATAPAEAALQLSDWRTLFLALSALTFAGAALIFFAVPEQPSAARGGAAGLRDQLRGVRTVFGSRFFWRLAPATIASQTAFLSVQSLWAGPWLADVAGLDERSVANHLFALAAAMTAGYMLLGALTERLARFGVRPIVVAAAGMLGFALVQAALAAGAAGAPLLLWIAFGFLGTCGVLPFAVLSQNFPSELAGRANTGLNLLVFVGAFLGQWGIGAVIGLWPGPGEGGYAPVGYQVAFGIVLALQVAGLLWLALPRRERRRSASVGG